MHALMLHGAGGGGWEWDLWRRVFTAAGIAAVAPDLQPAAAGLAATRFAEYRAQAAAAARALPEPRVLVGASLGGLLALSVAGEVSAVALVLVNPIPPAPLAARLPRRERAAVVPWHRDATLEGTRGAIPDADDAAALHAFRRWRDESGQVLAEAASGIGVAPSTARVLLLASRQDREVPVDASAALARQLDAAYLDVEASHVGPLLGRGAARSAAQAVAWLHGLRKPERPETGIAACGAH